MIGLGTYAYFWRHQTTLPDGSFGEPIDLPQMLRESAELGAEVFQICDYAPLLAFSGAELRDLRALATDLGLTLELGSRGIAPDHLATFLELAGILGVALVRSMLFAADSRPTLVEAERMLRTTLPHYAAAGVTLALETYEQVPSGDLVGLVETIGSPSLGICLDPANCVAALENPREVVERCAPYVANIHVKDFAFTRQAGWVGFELAGVPLGEGLLDYDHLVRTVDPHGRGISRIVEHWVPWQGDLAATVAIEDDWTSRNLAYLKEHT
jgi:sugar phosphate isomerase/epimerase